jgi:hypothetical protein
MKTKAALLTILACLLLACFVPAAFAQDAEAPMSDRELSKFIADWPAVVKWCEEKGKQHEDEGDASLPSALLVDSQFKAFLAKRGWSVERFGYVAGAVFSLMPVVHMERKSPEVAKQFDDAIAEIEAGEASRAEKDQMIQAINESKKSMLAVSGDKSINQAELKLVRARYEEIAAAAGIDAE